MSDKELIKLTAEIVSAYVSNNPVAMGEVPGFVQQVHASITALTAEPAASEPMTRKPAVPVRESVKPNYLACLVCGRKQTTIRRHLAAAHSMSPEEYRDAFELPHSYPVVAPNYAKRRREIAYSIGLGSNRRQEGSKSSRSRKAKPASQDS